MTKLCSKCGIQQNDNMFSKSKTSKDGLYAWCKSCYSTYHKTYSRKKQVYTREQQRRWQIKHYYGISQERYDSMWVAQGERCIVCNVTEQKNGRNFSVDHDHACCPGKKSCGKCVRAILCNRCNISLGLLKEDAELVQKLGNYINIFCVKKEIQVELQP